jgi:hypothetical protein
MQRYVLACFFIGCTALAKNNCLISVSNFFRDAAQGKKNAQLLASKILEVTEGEGKDMIEFVGRDRIIVVETQNNKHENTYTLNFPLKNGRMHTITVHQEKTKDGAVYFNYDEMMELVSALPLQTAQTTREITFPSKDPMGDPNLAASKVGGTATPGHIRIYPHASMVGSRYAFWHEHGHNLANYIYQQWFIQPHSEPSKAWKKAIKEDPFSPTSYGDKNAAEDFAEAFVEYIQSKGGTSSHSNIRYRWPRRCAILDQFFSGEFGSLDDEFFSQLRSYYRLQELKAKGMVAGTVVLAVIGSVTYAYYQGKDDDEKRKDLQRNNTGTKIVIDPQERLAP